MPRLDESETVTSYTIQGKAFSVVGFNWVYSDDPEDGHWEFYDVFYGGECLNLGEPLDQKPPREVVAEIARSLDIIT